MTRTWILMLLLGWLLSGALPACADEAKDRFDFAEALFIQLDYGSAAEEFQAYVKDYPGAKRIGTARYRIGECLFRTEQFGDAVAAYRKALESHPDAEQAALGQYNCARALERVKKTRESADAFASAAEKGDGEVRREALLGDAEARVELQQFERAAQSYQTLLEEFPKCSHAPDALFSLGWVQARRGNHEQAAATFRSFIAKYPESKDVARVRLALSDSLAAVQKYDESATVLEAVKDDGERAGEILLRKAWNQFRAGKKLQAASTFEKYATRFPESKRVPPALFNAGVAYFDAGQLAEAAQVFRKTLTAKPSQQRALDARYWIAACAFGTGNYADAAQGFGALAESLDSFPEQRRESILSMRAQALQHAGRSKVAVKHLETFLQSYPDSERVPVVRYTLATARQAVGNTKAAVSTLQRLLEDAPKSDVANDARFALAEYLYRLKRPGDAIPHLQALERRNALSVQARYRLAWCLYDTERFAPARDLFASLATASAEFRAETLYMAGRASERLNENDVAREWYQKTIQCDEESEHLEKAYLRLAHLRTTPGAVKDLFETYRKRFPDGEYHARIRLVAADASFTAGKIKSAEQHYRVLLKDSPTDAPAAYGLAWCLLEQDQRENADAWFQTALEHAAQNADFREDALLQRAEIAYRRDQTEKAKGFFSQLDDSESAGERATYMLGWCARRLGQPNEAKTWFERYVSSYPNGEFRGDAALRLAETARENGDNVAARTALESALKTLPPEQVSGEFLHLYADTLVELRDWKRTLEVCNRMAKDVPNADRPYLIAFRRGLACQALGLYEKADAAFRKTRDATDTVESARAQFNLGAVDFARGEFVDAAKKFLRVDMLYDYPELAPKALYHAVNAFRKAKDQRRAALYKQKLREEYPESEWAAKLTAEP